MKVTLLGHAAVLVEMTGATCLMDPVFHDPFEDGAVVSCPRRSIDIERIPKIDLLVISHRHLDHFDIPSLSVIAKRSALCDVLCPEDDAIVYALERLGFKNVHPEKPLKHFAFDSFEILTTRSYTTRVIEFGVVFKDRSGVFWNQVDSRIIPEGVPKVLQQAGRVDLLFAMYASQNFDFFESRGTGFPYETHALNLSNVLAIRPRLTVPGAAGFRFAGPGLDWCNSFLFPMSAERFVADLARLDPELATCIAQPGDVFHISPGEVKVRTAASPIAQTIENDAAMLRFDPTAAIPSLGDPNPGGSSDEDLGRHVSACLESFEAFLLDGYTTGADDAVQAYRKRRATYAIGVVFPNSEEQWVHVAFDQDQPVVTRSSGIAPVADAGHRIVASALTAWMSWEKTYFYLRAFSRKWCFVYELAAGDDGKASVRPINLPDLLAYYLERKADGSRIRFKKWIDVQIERARA